MAVPELEALAQAVRKVLDDRYLVREQALSDCRRVIRASANAIRSLHRGEWDEAEALMAEAAARLAGTQESLKAHPDILHAGFVADAAKEYAEARLTAALFAGRRLPLPDELALDPVPYLHGLGEAVGELRRRLLDRLRDGDLDEPERTLEAMGAIVDLLAEFDYPDGMTAGLRRTTDIARSLTERSRADLTATVVQERLRRELSERLDG